MLILAIELRKKIKRYLIINLKVVLMGQNPLARVDIGPREKHSSVILLNKDSYKQPSCL